MVFGQLKKMIKQTVNELSELGLRPAVLQRWFAECAVDYQLGRGGDLGVASPCCSAAADGCTICFDPSGRRRFPKIVYEFHEEDSRVEAQLHIPAESMEELSAVCCGVKEDGEGESVQDSNDIGDDNCDRVDVDVELENECALFERGLLLKAGSPGDDVLLDVEQGSGSPIRQTPPPTPTLEETIIPLTSSSAFFDLLYTTLQHMSVQLKVVEKEFRTALQVLSSIIGDTARPVSRSSCSCSHSGSGFFFFGGAGGGRGFRAVSPLKDHAGAICVGRTDLSNVCLFFFSEQESSFFSLFFFSFKKSDLYSWREIFQLYMEAEVFESMRERDRGERSVEECERRLGLFVDRVTRRGQEQGQWMKSKQGRYALSRFLQMNALILDIKKVGGLGKDDG